MRVTFDRGVPKMASEKLAKDWNEFVESCFTRHASWKKERRVRRRQKRENEVKSSQE